MTIEFAQDIGQISDRLDLLCDCLGIAYMSSPDGDKDHYSIAMLERTSDNKEVKVRLPVSTDFPGFIGIRVYHVSEFTLSRRFYFKRRPDGSFPTIMYSL